MKKLITFLFFIQSILLQSQAPQSFNYQATVRNNSGQLVINQNVYFKFNIIPNFETGIPVYSETHFAPTDELGHVNIIVGQGSATIGIFSQINWASGSYFMNIELNTGNGYINMGTTQLLSVPYALFAQNAGNNSIISNGTQVGQMLYWDGSQWTNLEPGLPGQLIYMNTSSIPAWGFNVNTLNVRCNGENNGVIELFFPENFNTSIYAFEWTGPNGFYSTHNSVYNLAPGNYNLTLTNTVTSSQYSYNYTVTQPTPVNINLGTISVSSPNCHGGDGSVTLNLLQGGASGNIINLNGTTYTGNSYTQSILCPSNSSYTFNTVPPGNYTVNIKSDSVNGCLSSNAGDINITHPNAIFSNIPGTYTVVVTKDNGVVSTYTNEVISVANGYKTTTTGQYAQGTLAFDQGFNFRESCGKLKVDNQKLFQNNYNILVNQTPNQLLASSKNQSNGIITIKYTITSNGGQSSSYTNVYTPN